MDEEKGCPKARLPRYRRVKEPPAFHLTQRDQEIIRWVYRCRYLSARQVLKLPSSDETRLYLFPRSTKSNVDKRLRLLFHHGYLWRIARPVDKGSSPAVYCLDVKGRDLIAQELQLDKHEVRSRRWLDFEKDLTFLDHTLAINDFRLSVEVAARSQGCQVAKWIDERELRGKEVKEYVDDPQSGRRVAILPDAYFVLRLKDGRLARHFLELDRGRQEQKAFRSKVRAYIEFVASGRYQERYQARSLRVLVVITEGERRLDDLRRWIEAEGGDGLFWLARLEQATPQNILSRSIWKLPGGQTTHSLLPQEPMCPAGDGRQS